MVETLNSPKNLSLMDCRWGHILILRASDPQSDLLNEGCELQAWPSNKADRRNLASL